MTKRTKMPKVHPGYWKAKARLSQHQINRIKQMHYHEGLSDQEIARTLAISDGDVYWALRKGGK